MTQDQAHILELRTLEQCYNFGLEPLKCKTMFSIAPNVLRIRINLDPFITLECEISIPWEPNQFYETITEADLKPSWYCKLVNYGALKLPKFTEISGDLKSTLQHYIEYYQSDLPMALSRAILLT